jgi:subfamily B ATP-binding cassette protein MsbA
MQNGLAAGERVMRLLDSPHEHLKAVSAANVPSFHQDICFNDVHFSYPECDDEVLRGISFTIKKGEVVAIVGSSGGGKSTILDLLPRFYEISSGSITIDGRDTCECDLAGLRSMFGIVSQETILFNDTIRNNIAYGCGSADTAAVESAARAANALDFIIEMQKGMDSVIGEKGDMLSGGQRQRIAIARALLRNPPVLILDEATSSLDTESERLVQSAINTLMQNRTVLVVAHRLSTILHADMILVLEDGRIVERGTHRDLLCQNGRYKHLYDIQFGATAIPVGPRRNCGLIGGDEHLST